MKRFALALVLTVAAGAPAVGGENWPQWRKKIDGANYQIGKHNMSSPSPVTDGKMVWWLTGTGFVGAYTLEGKEVWTADLQKNYVKLGLNWGYGASPLLYEGLLIVPMLH